MAVAWLADHETLYMRSCNEILSLLLALSLQALCLIWKISQQALQRLNGRELPSSLYIRTLFVSILVKFYDR
jgi:hypothetical protein